MSQLIFVSSSSLACATAPESNSTLPSEAPLPLHYRCRKKKKEKKNIPFGRAFALQNSSRNSSPAPDFVFFNIIVPRAPFSGGVFFFADTGRARLPARVFSEVSVCAHAYACVIILIIMIIIIIMIMMRRRIIMMLTILSVIVMILVMRSSNDNNNNNNDNTCEYYYCVCACCLSVIMTCLRSPSRSDSGTVGRGDDTVINPHRAQIYSFELFEFILSSNLD